jgi:7-keto-8-aminopelargonate synthetase-like enzyme
MKALTIGYAERRTKHLALWMENDNRRPLNFGTQDYLGLSTNQSVISSLTKFIEENGIIHSAGSPTLTGRTLWTAGLILQIC